MTSLVNWPVKIRGLNSGEETLVVASIDAVCAEGRWMPTLHYEPTPAWEHALAETECSCHLLLVVVNNPQIVGWCRAFPDGSTNSAKIGIGLLEEYRDQGLGTQLLQETIRWANQAGFAQLKLTTRPDNTRAIHVFRKLGFVSTSRTEQGQVEMVRRLTRIDCNKETEL